MVAVLHCTCSVYVAPCRMILTWTTDCWGSCMINLKHFVLVSTIEPVSSIGCKEYSASTFESFSGFNLNIVRSRLFLHCLHFWELLKSLLMDVYSTEIGLSLFLSGFLILSEGWIFTYRSLSEYNDLIYAIWFQTCLVEPAVEVVWLVDWALLNTFWCNDICCHYTAQSIYVTYCMCKCTTTIEYTSWTFRNNG